MINNYPLINIYEKNSLRSKISSQLLYGEKFQILMKKKDWLKIKTSYDKYSGYIRVRKFIKDMKITHKISSLRADLYLKPEKNSKVKVKLPFCSLICVNRKIKNFYKFGKYWVEKKDVMPLSYKQNIFKNIKMFMNIPYKWGGKSYKGIDCSALVQLFFKFNNLYCPRDTKDQIKYFKKANKIKKDAIIFWRGHVAVCLSKNILIHAYGPKKKVLIMNINKTLKLIEKTARLKVIGIR
tara:strand:+ start:2443 stop:3156 length:714 start_codon:yes stop_codon:yes gene_type:complete